MRAINRLSAQAVNRAKEPGMYPDGDGLYLNVAPGGSKSWILRYRFAGKRHNIGLGSVRLVGLAEARQRAYEHHRVLRLDGTNPLADRQQATATITFREASEAFYDAHRDGWKPRHAETWLQTVRDTCWPVFGSLPVQAVDTALIVRALRPLWSTQPVTASRLRGRIEGVLDYAASLGYRQGENPARWKGHLEYQFAKPSKVATVEHHGALPYAELPAFMSALRQSNSIAAPALEFLILTAARAGEVIGALWSEIDMAGRVWVIPAARMKNGKEHRVPLSDATMAILERMAEIRHSDHVFPGTRGGAMSPTLFLDFLRRHGHKGITVHGFRSTFSQWAAERTEYQFEVREMALAHSVGSAVERAYQRSDLFERRRALMDDWAKFCAQPASGEVVPLRSAT